MVASIASVNVPRSPSATGSATSTIGFGSSSGAASHGRLTEPLESEATNWPRREPKGSGGVPCGSALGACGILMSQLPGSQLTLTWIATATDGPLKVVGVSTRRRLYVSAIVRSKSVLPNVGFQDCWQTVSVAKWQTSGMSRFTG